MSKFACVHLGGCATLAPVPRILLIELAVIGRFHRAVLFPQLAGFLRGAGVAMRWIRFALAPEREQGADGIGLSAPDMAFLRQAVLDFGADRVVLSRFPGPALTAEILAAGVPVVRVLGDTYAGGAHPPGTATLGSSLDAWRSLAEAPGAMPSAPSFAYEAGNDDAKTLQPLPYLVLGAECTYDRALSSHPLYRDIDLSACVRASGCTFCNRPPTSATRAFSPDDVRDQLVALRATWPPFDGRVAVRLLGEPAISHVETIAAYIRELGFAPSDWLLDSRADRLATCESSIGRACAVLDGTGHCMHVALVGLESFVRDDLERMNKGTSPLQNMDAALALLRLERDYPRSFSHRVFGGLSTIFFTPWTTLEDLAMNLRVVQQCGLADLAGKVLADRVRLEPDLPMTRLAARDGLLVERYDDLALDTASRNFYGRELPWRFRDARVEPLSRIFVRLRAAATGQPLDDSLGQAVAAWWENLSKRRFGPVDAALRLVDTLQSILATQESPPIPSPEQLLQTYDALFEAREAPAPGADQPASPAPAPAVGGREVSGEAQRKGRAPSTDKQESAQHAWAAYLAELCRAGLKPVTKIEPVELSDVDALLHVVNPPFARTKVLDSTSGRKIAHVFFGESAALVDAAMEWTARGEHDASDQARDRAVAEAGKLLGYPACCAESFAFKETPRSRLAYGWMHLDRRVRTPGEVDPVLNPWALPVYEVYVPCSLTCTATLELLHDAEAVARRIRGSAAIDEELASCRNPWLVVLAGQGSAVELVPQEEPGDRFHFRAGRRSGSAAQLDIAAQADEVVLEHERLRLLRSGRLVSDLSMQAFVWWYRRALQPELWSRVLALRELMGRDQLRAGRSSLDVDESLRLGPQMMALRKLLASALADLIRESRLQHIRVLHLKPVSAGMLSLALAAGGRSVELYVADAAQTTQQALRIGPFAIMRPEHQPIRDGIDKAVIQALSTQLSAWLVARQRTVRRRGKGA